MPRQKKTEEEKKSSLTLSVSERHKEMLDMVLRNSSSGNRTYWAEQLIEKQFQELSQERMLKFQVFWLMYGNIICKTAKGVCTLEDQHVTNKDIYDICRTNYVERLEKLHLKTPKSKPKEKKKGNRVKKS